MASHEEAERAMEAYEQRVQQYNPAPLPEPAWRR